MPDLVPSWRLPSSGRRSAAVALAVLAIVVVGAVIGGWLARSGPIASPSGGTAPASVILLDPAPGNMSPGNGQVGVLGLVSGSLDDLDVVVMVDGVEVGSLEVDIDAAGPFSVVVPLLPPVDGGPAVVEVRRAGDDVALASVDIVLEPADHLIVWAPQPRDRVEGPSFEVVGFARPPARSVLLELCLPDGSAYAPGGSPFVTETVDLDTSSSSSEVPAPWRGFEASVSLPADAAQACLSLYASALGPSGRSVFGLAMPLTLVGAPGVGCP